MKGFFIHWWCSVKLLVVEALILSEEMGRTPCCDKKGLKKGPWTPEEDEILIEYIKKNGHGSWRSLPKLAGFIFLSFVYKKKIITLDLFRFVSNCK